MRFLVMMIPNPRTSKQTESGAVPTRDELAAMGRYNEELAKAGVLLAVDGLHATSKGARVSFAGGKPSVKDGPFTEATEVVGGYWLWQVKSRDEALEWARRCPALDGDTLELRQVFEMGEFLASLPAR